MDIVDKEISQFDYNCGGFALQTYDWVTPYDYEEETPDAWNEEDRISFIEECISKNINHKMIIEEVLKRDTEYLLHKYPNLREISIEDYPINERVIAYRIGIDFDGLDIFSDEDTDFHFRIRIGGVWYEKLGIGKVSKCVCKNIYDDWAPGDFTYNSPIKFFILKD